MKDGIALNSMAHPDSSTPESCLKMLLAIKPEHNEDLGIEMMDAQRLIRHQQAVIEIMRHALTVKASEDGGSSIDGKALEAVAPGKWLVGDSLSI